MNCHETIRPSSAPYAPHKCSGAPIRPFDHAFMLFLSFISMLYFVIVSVASAILNCSIYYCVLCIVYRCPPEFRVNKYVNAMQQGWVVWVSWSFTLDHIRISIFLLSNIDKLVNRFPCSGRPLSPLIISWFWLISRWPALAMKRSVCAATNRYQYLCNWNTTISGQRIFVMITGAAIAIGMRWQSVSIRC